MIGFYNYTVWLTYASAASAVVGTSLALRGYSTWAVALLMLSGFFDSIDGMVARTKKDRTAEEKLYGIQIDSLCDALSFGAYPALICYTLGVDGVIGVPILVFYCLCGIIRLAYFNVLEGTRTAPKDPRCYYRGMPITFMSAIFPLVYVLRVFLPQDVFQIVLHVALLAVGLLFILDVPFPRTKKAVGAGLMLLDLVALGVCLYYGV